jgi:hypothetical protein
VNERWQDEAKFAYGFGLTNIPTILCLKLDDLQKVVGRAAGRSGLHESRNTKNPQVITGKIFFTYRSS